MADRRGPRWVVTTGIATLACSYVLLWVGERSGLSFAGHIAVLLVGVILLDLGAQLTQVGNQTRIFGLVPSARSRLNTVYMTVYFAGAAVGSALSTIVWVRWKWDGVCAVALGLIALAGLRHARLNPGCGSSCGFARTGRRLTAFWKSSHRFSRSMGWLTSSMRKKPYGTERGVALGDGAVHLPGDAAIAEVAGDA